MPPTAKPRLLVVSSTFPRWAGDREPPFVFELTRRLVDHYKIWVLAPHAPGAKTLERMGKLIVIRYRYFFERGETLVQGGGILANLGAGRWRYGLVPFFMLLQWWALVRLLRRVRFDLIHAHWLIPQGLLALLARPWSRKKPALLCTSHGGDLFGLRSTPWRHLKRWILTRAEKTTVVSRSMLYEALALGGIPGRLAVVPMGVDLRERFIPEPAEKRNLELFFAGRLVEKKGVDVLLEAMPTILQCYPEARLTIAGDGTQRESLQALAAHLGISGQVNLLGAVSNSELPSLYRRSQVVVFPSIVAIGGDREGFGLVPVEALGCECAIVATDLPAMRDTVLPGKTGLVVPQQDPAALAHAVVELLGNPFLREYLGRNGRAFVLEHFDWGLITDRYHSLLESLRLGDT